MDNWCDIAENAKPGEPGKFYTDPTGSIVFTNDPKYVKEKNLKPVK